jgi:hypothetical protein
MNARLKPPIGLACAIAAVWPPLFVSAESPGDPRGPARPPEALVVSRMETDHMLIRQAMVVLDQNVNPVKIVGAEQIAEIYARAAAAPRPPLGLNAFRMRGVITDPHIYVNSDSAIYKAAAVKPSNLTILKLAATLAHEQVHNTDGDFAAYRLQSDFVRSKLNTLPRRQREEARAYLQQIEAKARALEYVTEGRRRPY